MTDYWEANEEAYLGAYELNQKGDEEEEKEEKKEERIYLKGMTELPMYCNECGFRLYHRSDYDGDVWVHTCGITHEDILEKYLGYRASECPLVMGKGE
jgi:hypothetical protein